ncbi:MAG: hypothetical protein PF447_03445 [Spirochaetaceae bacterium]|jgi:hypothetical protein|nr:hypothetical protein [Spirochaetaceae bacterium]
MKTSFFNQLTGTIHLKYTKKLNMASIKKGLTNGKKQLWENQEIELQLHKLEDTLQPEIEAKTDIYLESLTVTININKNWRPLLESEEPGPWLFLGQRNLKEYVVLSSNEDTCPFQIHHRAKGKFSITWYIQSNLHAGEKIRPGTLENTPGDPRITCRSLPLPTATASKLAMQPYRLFEPETLESSSIEDLWQKERSLWKDYSLTFEGVILPQEMLPEPEEKNAKERNRQMEYILTDIRRDGIKAAAQIHPLHIAKKLQLCKDKPHWFIQTANGSPVMVHKEDQSWQILDHSNEEVQQYLLKKLERYRGWGFTVFLLKGMEDLLIPGRRWNQNKNALQRIILFKKLLRQGLGEVATIISDKYYPIKGKDLWDGYYPSMDKKKLMKGIFPLINLFPLAAQGSILSLGTLYLNKLASSHSEKLRERIYNFQLITGGLAILGGSTASMDQGTAEKWIRLIKYHGDKGGAVLRMEPLGFQQDILLLHSAKGIAGLFNFKGRKRYIKLTDEENISKKPLRYNDETGFKGSELYITLPAGRSRILKYK